MKELKTAGVRLPDSPLVPYPSRSLVPERDVRYAPVLEASRLGIDFGGLTAVDDFTLTITSTTRKISTMAKGSSVRVSA